MSYPPQEGYPHPQPALTQPTGPQPAVQYPAPPPGAPGYPPVAPQISGVPYGPPEPRRKPAVLVLAIATAVLFVFGGLMFGLYLNERGTLNDTKTEMRDTRTELTSQVEEQKSIVTEQEEKLAAAEKRAADLDKELGTTKTNMAEMKAQRDVLVPCMRRIQDAFDAAANGDSAGINRALRSARTTCDKAEIKVDS